jgi:hypothetical protein
MHVLYFEDSGLCRRTPVRPVLLTSLTGTHRSDRSGAAAAPSSVLRSWLCGSTKEPSGFLVNHWKPRELDSLWEDQDTKEEPKNWQVPEVDFLSNRHPAKSASEKP